MTSTIASCRLWCREGDSLLEFEIELGTPYKNREKWFCDWAIGDIDRGLVFFTETGPERNVIACSNLRTDCDSWSPRAQGETRRYVLY